MLGLHGGRAENGELQAMCEMRGIPFTGSGSASSHLAFDKVAAKRFAAIAGVKAPAGVALEDIEAALAEYGKLIAKPARDGSSYGLIFVNSRQDLVAVRNAAKTEEYLIEPFISGVEATCGVLEQSDGSLMALPPIEIIPAEGGFGSTTAPNIWPNRPRKSAPAALRPKSPRSSWTRRSGRTRRCRAAAIPVPTSSSRRRGRFFSKPIPCRA